jgi:hypothetical protein
MKNSNPSSQKYKLIASHALVVAIVTAPYFTAVWGDIYNLAKIGLASMGLLTTVAAPVVIDETQRMSMSLLSTTAAIIAVVAFAVYMSKRRK